MPTFCDIADSGVVAVVPAIGAELRVEDVERQNVDLGDVSVSGRASKCDRPEQSAAGRALRTVVSLPEENVRDGRVVANVAAGPELRVEDVALEDVDLRRVAVARRKQDRQSVGVGGGHLSHEADAGGHAAYRESANNDLLVVGRRPCVPVFWSDDTPASLLVPFIQVPPFG